MRRPAPPRLNCVGYEPNGGLVGSIHPAVLAGCRHPHGGGSVAAPERRRENLSIRPAHALFPEFDYSRRKFTPSDPGASAGFRPHLKQGVIFAE